MGKVYQAAYGLSGLCQLACYITDLYEDVIAFYRAAFGVRDMPWRIG